VSEYNFCQYYIWQIKLWFFLHHPVDQLAFYSELTFTLRALFPILSSSGDHTHIPITFGTTSRMQPETVDFAGRPTLNAKLPEYSYMPQDCIRDSVLQTDVGLSTVSLVIGQQPPLASVAAINAPVFTVISTEQSYRKQTLMHSTQLSVWDHINTNPS